MKILIAITVIILLLLLYSVRIKYSFRLENFDFSVKVLLKIPFSIELYNSKKTKKEKTAKKEEENKKSKKKIDLKTIGELKEPATDVISQLCGVIKRHCRITKMDTFIKTALEDPMENGIAFGIISGVFNIGTAILMDRCKVKNIDLKIESDFESGEGLIFESFGTLRVRPIILVFALIFNFKLIRAIKNIMTILKREDIENG